MDKTIVMSLAITYLALLALNLLLCKTTRQLVLFHESFQHDLDFGC
jgi:hypothetical protein